MATGTRPQEDASALYSSGRYWDAHPEWLAEHRTPKSDDMLFALEKIADETGASRLRIADVGTGTGASFHTCVEDLRGARPGLEVEMHGYDIATNAVTVGRERFPDISFHLGDLDPADGPFDVVSFLDVLEHLENPLAAMRRAASCAEWMLVRQPLLEGFSTFRHDAYKTQIRGEGHIAFFSYRSFLSLAEFCGWRPAFVRLLPPWEQAGAERKPSMLKRSLVGLNRELSSYFLSGFYLNGAFRRIGSA